MLGEDWFLSQQRVTSEWNSAS